MNRVLAYGITLVALAAIGCGSESGPPTVPATGVVTYEGNPVEGAMVVFAPENSGSESVLAAQAETDATGAFVMQTYVGTGSGGSEQDSFKSGLVPGDYLVSITKLEVVQDMRRRPKHLLPEKYSVPKSSGLSAKVEEAGENRFVFELK